MSDMSGALPRQHVPGAPPPVDIVGALLEISGCSLPLHRWKRRC